MKEGWQSLFPYVVDESLTLTLLQLEDAEPIFALIDESREELREWLPWVDASREPTHTLAFLEIVQQQHAEGRGFQVALREHGQIVGIAGLHGVNTMHRSTSIGYWLASSAVGRGLMTRAVRGMLALLFDELGLHRVEIRAATGNARSRAIPERLGFTREGVARESEWVNDQYLDLVMYGILEHEWRQQHHDSAQT